MYECPEALCEYTLWPKSLVLYTSSNLSKMSDSTSNLCDVTMAIKMLLYTQQTMAVTWLIQYKKSKIRIKTNIHYGSPLICIKHRGGTVIQYYPVLFHWVITVLSGSSSRSVWESRSKSPSLAQTIKAVSWTPWQHKVSTTYSASKNSLVKCMLPSGTCSWHTVGFNHQFRLQYVITLK